VLSHELAHSWSGNLVTNATLRDGWLNEGFTTYLERRIMEAVYGEERAGLEWGNGEQDLRLALAELAPDEAWRGGMAPDLAGRPVDEGSAVAYEKGALFLYQLERRFGRARLDAFLQGWFDRHAFTSVTTPQFVAELQQELIAKYPGRVDDQFVARWIDGVGIPDDAEFVHSAVLARVDEVRKSWEQGTLATQDLPAGRWTTQEWLHFITRMTRPQPVPRLQELDQRFQLTQSRNAEIAHAWYRLAIASGYPGLEPTLERYLTSIGRLKLIRPLYEDLLRSPAHAAFARRVYAEARPGYHAIAQLALDKVMQEATK
jgi:leukotriene-A4 hydrolase